MLRLAGGQVESLLDELLPVEVRELPPELAVLDRLLADPRLLAPITQAWEQAARGHGRPTIPMTSFARLMVVKQRTGWGYQTLVREVSDSLHLRRFCLLPLTQRVPDESTVRKLVRRLGPEVVAELTRVVIGKAQRETRFRARAVRIDSTVVEADIRYPADGMLAWQGARVLAREGRKLAGRLRGPAVRVVDRSRRIGKLVRAIAKTLARRTGQRVEEVLALNAKAGQAMARSVREARALARQARAAARGRGARAKLRAAWRLEELADRCQRVATQIQQRSRGQRISNRLVSLSDPDARPIRKGKLGKPNEFGYVVQVAEVTANTRRGARGFVLPAATAPATRARTACWPRPPPSWTAWGFDHARSPWMAALCPARPQRPSPGWRRRAPSSRGVPSRARGAPAGGWPATAPAARAASATSSAAMGCDAAACGATRASGSGPAGRSWPTTWTPSPSTPPDKTRIGGTSHHCAGRQADRPPHPHPFIRGK
jgi:transposase, IS5 family